MVLRDKIESFYCMSFNKISTQFSHYISKCLTEITPRCSKIIGSYSLHQPSASIPEGLKPPLVLNADSLIISRLIYQNLTG